MSELVTGEAVVLGLRAAKLPSRALAIVIDLVVIWATFIAVSMALIAGTASLDTAARAAVSVATFLLVLVGAPIAVETLSHGRSLGKAACGLRVVRDDGGPIRFRHALVRGAMGVVEILMTFGVVAVIASLVSARGRRLGDVFAGTLVVRERIPVPRGVRMPPPPPWLAGQFARLDLSRVPDGLWLAIRQYLTRMGQLDPQVGWALAVQLAGDVAACTGTPVPEGVPPAVYLAGVAGERQARDAQRAFGGTAAAAPYGQPLPLSARQWHAATEEDVRPGASGSSITDPLESAPIAAGHTPRGTGGPGPVAASPEEPTATGRTGFVPPA
ncbi:RDD family protein [Streptomyces sp. KR80]|uniref:RDD family protein n=1 Tax=Streptomyces sp. KR80 TaxID=3457426 RepID=UPI003FD1B8DA